MNMAPVAVETNSQSVPVVEKALVNGEEARMQSEHEEYQYLHLIQDILDFGEHRPDRCVKIHSRLVQGMRS